MIVSALVLEIQRVLTIVQPRGFGAVQIPIFSYEEYISTLPDRVQGVLGP